MELTGTVKKILEQQSFSSGFTKQELILQTQEQYPQVISIEFLQDRMSLLNDIKPGDDIKVSINIKGREWVNPEGVTKYFVSINGWRIEKLDGTSTASNNTQSSNSESFNQQAADISKDEDEYDDLPF